MSALSSPSPSSTLVGRDRELGVLRQSLEAALTGHGGVMLVSGEAGIGKLALAASLCREATELGALVLQAVEAEIQAQHCNVHRDNAGEQGTDGDDPDDAAGDARLPDGLPPCPRLRPALRARGRGSARRLLSRRSRWYCRHQTFSAARSRAEAVGVWNAFDHDSARVRARASERMLQRRDSDF